MWTRFTIFPIWPQKCPSSRTRWTGGYRSSVYALGAQLLARALGSPVRPDHAREIGWSDVDLTAEGMADPVLSAFGPRQQVFQWHEDAIELPAGAVHLASSEACEVQAFRFGECAYAFQFHLEVDRSLIERWLDRTGYQPLAG